MCNADLPTCLLICQNLVVRRLDLSSMKTVRDFAREVIETEERTSTARSHTVFTCIQICPN